MCPGAGRTGTDQGELTTGAPDLAVLCSRGLGWALVSGHLQSWKQKWGKSDSNFFFEPVKKHCQDGKINIMIKALIT